MSSMSSVSTSPRPSVWDRLPSELVKHIIQLVREPDEAFQPRVISRAPPSPVDSDDETDSEQYEADICQGRFSSRYGRGVLALSAVSKAWRAAALPLLFETVTGSQLGKFHFRSSIAGYPRAALIKHISLCGPSESDVINAALALQHLSNLCRLTVESGTLPKILASSLAVNSPWADEEDRNKRRRLKIHAEQCEVARLAFLAHRDKFPAVEIVDVSTEMVAALLSTFVGTGLKRLTISAYNIFRPSLAEQIKGAIQRSAQLSDPHLFDTTSNPIDLPSLAHLTVLGGGAANNAVAIGYTRMAQGIHVSVRWVAEKRSCLQAEYPQWWEKQATDDKDGLPLAQKGRKAAIDSTLRWAMSHAEGLCEREDEVGLKELGEALIRVREVEILARQ
ncbi:hypothetical protein JCM11641_006766 [Rhodosporidiobolus odoratus]